MNDIDLDGRNAVITGGARGIGYAIAERLLRSGARCSLWDINQMALENARQSLGTLGQGHTAVVDVTDPKSVEAATSATFHALTHVDILVNNAGVAGVTKKLWECRPDEW